MEIIKSKLLARSISLIIIVIQLSGCSIYRTVKPKAATASKYNNGNNNILAIDSSDLRAAQFTVYGSTHDLTVKYGDDLLANIINDSKKHFKDVLILNPNVKQTYDVLLYADAETKSVMGVGGGGSFLFVRKMPYRINVMDTKKQSSGEITDNSEMYRPDGVIPLSILTILSLGILSPITIPAEANISANAITKEVAKTNKKLSKLLVDKLIFDNLHIKTKYDLK